MSFPAAVRECKEMTALGEVPVKLFSDAGSTPAASTILEALNSQWIQGFSLYSCGFPRIPQFAFVPHAAAGLFLRRIAHATAHGDHHGQTENQPGLPPAGFLFADECRWLCRWCGKVILSGQKSSDGRAKAEPPTADANRIRGGRPNGQQRFSTHKMGL